MLGWEEISDHLKGYQWIRTNKKIEYLNVESAFDIETSSIIIDGEKSAFMYIFMFGIGYGEPVYYGRTWLEFLTMLDLVKDHYQLSLNRRLVIYVHNLAYEFQFMRKYFEWENVFSVGERKPIKAVTVDGIEFRDSYILSGFSLAKTAENLQTHEVDKLTGDLDYSKIRTHETPLTDQELAYCNNDIEVVNAYINEQITQYKDITKIPLTNTGRVRKYVRHNCYYTNTNHRKSSRGKYTRYRKIMTDLQVDPEDYPQLKRAFMGGFTHANANYSGQVLENVSSIDFTSSYPAVMLAERYPMSRSFTLEVNSLEEFERYCQEYALIFDVQFYNIRATFFNENYISESKCFQLEGATLNNGRVFEAEYLSTTLTNVDFDIIRQVYDWDQFQVTNVKAYHLGYLPKPIIESVLELYQGKTELKGVEGYEVEYMLSKGMLNSIYGMSVTDIVKDQIVYSCYEQGEHWAGDWATDLVDVEEVIKNYNESKSRFLFYPWGVFITAYARRNLWTGILAFQDDYIYSDTDSIKLLNYEDHLEYIDWYNQNVIDKMMIMMKQYRLDPELLRPKTKEGVEKIIGVWDYEGLYSRFKTLGAKRYLVEEDDQLELTVAGLSKRNGLEYMLEVSEGDHTKVFDLFNDDLYIPAEKTGKMTHTYIDHDQTLTVTDYLGKTVELTTLSGVHLGNADFTLNIAKEYGRFLGLLSQGYLFKGVDYK